VTVTKSGPWPSRTVIGFAGRGAASVLRTPTIYADQINPPVGEEDADRPVVCIADVRLIPLQIGMFTSASTRNLLMDPWGTGARGLHARSFPSA
jgi:hypothetical protein